MNRVSWDHSGTGTSGPTPAQTPSRPRTGRRRTLADVRGSDSPAAATPRPSTTKWARMESWHGHPGSGPLQSPPPTLSWGSSAAPRFRDNTDRDVPESPNKRQRTRAVGVDLSDDVIVTSSSPTAPRTSGLVAPITPQHSRTISFRRDPLYASPSPLRLHQHHRASMLPWPASDAFTTHHHTAHAAPSPPPPPPPPNAPHTIPRVHVALHFGSSPIQTTQESPSPHHRHNPPPLLPPSQDHHDQDLREHHIDPIRDSSPFHLDSSQHRSRHVPPLTQLGTASLFQSQTPRRNNSAPPPVLTQQTPTNNSSRVSALSPWRLSGGWSQVGVPPADSHAADKDPDGQAQYSSSPPSRWFPHRKRAPQPVDLHVAMRREWSGGADPEDAMGGSETETDDDAWHPHDALHSKTQAGDHNDHDDFDFDLSDPYAHIPLALTPAPVRALREPLPPPPPPRLASPHSDVPHSQDEDPIVFTCMLPALRSSSPLDPLHSSPTETGDRWTVTSRPAQVHRAPQLPVESQEQSSAPKAPVFYFGTLSDPPPPGPTTLGFSRVAASLRKSTLTSLTSLHTWQLTVYSASRLPSLLYLVHGQLTHAPPNARLAFALPCNVRALVRAATSVVAHGGQGVSDPMWVKVEHAIRAQRGDGVKLKLGEVVGRTLVQGEWVLLARGFALV